MEKLIAQLITQLMRLYVAPGTVSAQQLAQHVQDPDAPPLALETADGLTRAIAIPFDKGAASEEAGHWSRLCAVASALQVEHGFPAPAVSVDGLHGYCLWISLEAPVAVEEAGRLVQLLRDAYFADVVLRADPAPPLPPCPNPAGGRWAAFIHPGMGASFADEPGLDLAPPPHAQAAFLEGLESTSLAQFRQALQVLQPSRPEQEATGSAPAATDALLLRDATLEDIVRHLHAKNIEPTFRHLLPGAR